MKTIITIAALGVALTGCQMIPGTDAHKIAQAEKAVAATLKDPTSPLFTNVRTVKDGVCGQVNGKNSFGAYAGNQGFVWRDDGETTLENFEHPTNVGITASTRCHFRIEYAACQAGGSILSASVQAGSECSDVGINAIKDDFAEKARNLY